MSVLTQLEYRLAASRGIDLAWLTRVAPETALRWRQDNNASLTLAISAEIITYVR